MKLGHLFLAAALTLTPLASHAASQLSNFPLADRIKEKVASGKPLDIYVSYHDVSNEFAPFMKAGVAKAAAEDKVNAQFIGPTGPNANAQISEIDSGVDPRRPGVSRGPEVLSTFARAFVYRRFCL